MLGCFALLCQLCSWPNERYISRYLYFASADCRDTTMEPGCNRSSSCACQERLQDISKQIDRMESLLIQLTEERAVAVGGRRNKEFLRTIAGRLGHAVVRKMARDILSKDAGKMIR